MMAVAPDEESPISFEDHKISSYSEFTVRHGLLSSGGGNLVWIDDIRDHFNRLRNNRKKKLRFRWKFHFLAIGPFQKHCARNVKVWYLFHCKQLLPASPQSPTSISLKI
ncbi:hypothetical protein TNCT_239791 [Trichonephila clavata]|uniref:Uncharacterized protein n=1 Tax=Trichonephila clavata TaxID=2740835 RepID=A0A8X6IBX5_TRICU|nr:hypothetical protein TNCT_239791 [Trichonephila clavata]